MLFAVTVSVELVFAVGVFEEEAAFDVLGEDGGCEVRDCPEPFRAGR